MNSIPPADATAPAGEDQPSEYRPDIDGLRAVAVLCVIAFHFDIPPFRGGFAGVDVFFVISGFLIGRIVLNEAASGSFSLARFYERRARRILPALFAMLAVVFVAGRLFLLPNALTELGWSMLAAIGAVSNFRYAGLGDYLDTRSAADLLLHSWSLGVEEQFYLCFPFLVLALRRFAPRFTGIGLVAVALVSFVWSAAMLRSDPAATFYWPGTRAWELLTGAILAAGLIRGLERRWQREAAGLLGVAMIAFATVYLSAFKPFPGPWALLPCLGAALVIHSGATGDTLVARCLSVRPAVFVGLISYSLYLWHWPIVPLLGQHMLVPWFEGLAGKAIVLALVFLVAAASWRYVEQPFRKGRIGKRALFVSAGAAAAMLATGATAAILAGGWPARVGPRAAYLASFSEKPASNVFRRGTCFLTGANKYSDYRRDLCLAPVAGKSNILLVGDSHAAHLWAALADTLDANVMQVTSAGCRPTRPAKREAGAGSRCQLFEDFFDGGLGTPDAVILAARWRAGDVPAIASTLDLLKRRGLRVVLVGPVVGYAHPLPQLLARAAISGSNSELDRDRRSDGAMLDRRLEALAREKGSGYASPYRATCTSHGCRSLTDQGVPLQFDQNHYTREGALAIVRAMAAQGGFGAIPLR